MCIFVELTAKLSCFHNLSFISIVQLCLLARVCFKTGEREQNVCFVLISNLFIIKVKIVEVIDFEVESNLSRLHCIVRTYQLFCVRQFISDKLHYMHDNSSYNFVIWTIIYLLKIIICPIVHFVMLNIRG